MQNSTFSNNLEIVSKHSMCLSVLRTRETLFETRAPKFVSSRTLLKQNVSSPPGAKHVLVNCYVNDSQGIPIKSGETFHPDSL